MPVVEPATLKTRGPDDRLDFVIYAGLNKAFKKKVTTKAADGTEATNDELYLSGVASSTVQDRHGDTMTARAQASMLAQLQQGFGRDGHSLLMFLNHEYDVPEDVLGSCTESQLIAQTPVDGQDSIIDLEIVCRVTQANPRAVMAWQIVNEGHTIGYSIGGTIVECEVDEENDDGESWCPPLLIDDLALYEISACGIPANPRSYTDGTTAKAMTNATKALVRDLGLPDDVPEPTKDWPQAMRRGFVRNATRDPKVRAQLRRALPALKARGPEELPTDGGDPVTPNDPVPDETGRKAATAKEQSAIAASIGCLQAAKAHGMCDDAMGNVQAALDSLNGALADDDESKQLVAQLALIRALPDAQRTALFAAVTTIAKDASLEIVTSTTDELAAKRAELAQAVADATKRVDEATAAKAERDSAVAARDAAKAEIDAATATLAELNAKIADAKKTPLQRATDAGSGSDRDGVSHRRAGSVEEARARVRQQHALL